MPWKLRNLFTKTHNEHITIFKPRANSKRIKIRIPYSMKSERNAFKQLNSSFYHPNQKLWSILNTQENQELLKQLFGDKLLWKEEMAAPKMPEIHLSPKGLAELEKNHQKLVLKGLSAKLLHLLREYYKVHRPSYWLFEGQDGGQYSAKSVQNIFRNAVKGAKANPWSTPHTLRHSFATH